MTYDKLIRTILWSRDSTLDWLYSNNLIAKSRICPVCQQQMKLCFSADRHDGLKWQCRRTIDRVRHQRELSIRHQLWFSQSNMSIEEPIKYTYWWCAGLKQDAIHKELRIATHTGVDWNMFCRELCLEALLRQDKKIGGVGCIIEIDECKIGKRKYHKGHRG